MRVRLLAKRYAVALLELALENKIQDKVQQDMILIGCVLSENHLLGTVLHNPVISSHKKISIFNKIFEGKIEKLTLRFLQLITKKSRENYLQAICISYDEVYKDYNNIMPVMLTTAYDIEENVQEKIMSKLAKIAGKTPEVTKKIDENLIGGFTLHFMDYQYDASVRMQLKQLRKEFSENLYVKKY